MARTDPATLASLVGRAKDHDQHAWEELVDRLGNMVWAVTRSFSLNEEDAVDVGQTVWLRLAERIGDLREPERVDAWLMTTARFECRRLSRSAERTRPVESTADFTPAAIETPETVVLQEERDTEVWRAVNALDEPCRTLVKLCLVDPPLSYEELAGLLGIPGGTLGPRRRRCLRRLETKLRGRVQEDDSDD